MTAEQEPTSPEGRKSAKGAGGFWVLAAMALPISADTSWRFFGEVLNITNHWERIAMFAILEVAFLACAWATRANVRRGDSPGHARTFAWILCGLAAFMAIVLSGPLAGAARVALGPILGLVALHLALGIELRAAGSEAVTPWGRIKAELRERFMSRLGLGDDERKAAERTRDRARERAARLATADGWPGWGRARRLARAVRASGATSDAAQRALLVEQVGVLRNIDDLKTAQVESPWSAAVPPYVQRLVDAAKRSAEAQHEAAERDAAAMLDEARRQAEALREAAQHEAQRLAAAAHDEALAVRATADHAAAGIRSSADEFRRQAEEAAQRAAMQVKAEAVADAERIRADALAQTEVLRAAPERHVAQRPIRVAAQRVEASVAPSPDALVAALAALHPTEVPSLRSAAQHLRERFGSCSDRRVAEAVAALRAKRDAPANGHRPDLANSTN